MNYHSGCVSMENEPIYSPKYDRCNFHGTIISVASGLRCLLPVVNGIRV